MKSGKEAMPQESNDIDKADDTLVVGWEQMSAVPDGHRFNSFLKVKDGKLFLEDLNLTQVLDYGQEVQGLEQTLPTPLEIVYLPIIRRQIRQMNEIFAAAIAETGYNGRFF